MDCNHRGDGLIIADVREPPSYRKIADEVRFLDHGDYIIEVDGQRMVFERKTYTDLFNSIKSGRLEEQLSHSDVLLVDTKFKYKYLNIQKVQMIVNTISIKMPVLYINTPKSLYSMLKSIEQKMKDGTLYTTQLRKPTFDHTYSDPRIAVLAAFPHIGVKKAKQILDEFENLASFFEHVLEIDPDRCNDTRYIRSLRISNLQGFGIKIVRDVVEFIHR